MHDLIGQALLLLCDFLERLTVLLRLYVEQAQERIQEVPGREPSPAQSDTTTLPSYSSLAINTPRTPSPGPEVVIPSSSSPRLWRGRGSVTNSQLRREYDTTGQCSHYFHEAARPVYGLCPICRATRNDRT